MIFAIYRGFIDEPDDGDGVFTKGRLYVATSIVGDGAVDMNNLIIKDDDDEQIKISPENDRFEYPEEVFGVIVKTLGARTPGEVVVINEADDEGEFLSIKGMGFVRAENIQLLDSVMVKPGMMVFERESMHWGKIRRVDECMRIQFNGDDSMRECVDFVFAISDGELAMIPLIKCVEELDNVTKDSLYRLKGLDEGGMLLVDDDNGNEFPFNPTAFEFV